jgi:cytochrome c-type biogenesis protein CcmF
MNEETGKPIIKAFVNPLVSWIWVGALVIVFGTIVALFPNMQAATVKQRVLVAEPVPAEAGD